MSGVDSKTSQNWPFDIWFRLAVLHMHISPDDFWNMNVRDWFILCQPPEVVQFSKLDLTELMQAFPDEISSLTQKDLDNG